MDRLQLGERCLVLRCDKGAVEWELGWQDSGFVDHAWAMRLFRAIRLVRAVQDVGGRDR